jgi:hypothetical protein
LLDIDWQKFPADAKDSYRCWPMVRRYNRCYRYFTDVCPMVNNFYPMVAEESSVANPQKVAKIDEKIRKMEQT